MKIFDNVKYFQSVCLKFEDRFFKSLATLGLQTKAIIYSTI